MIHRNNGLGLFGLAHRILVILVAEVSLLLLLGLFFLLDQLLLLKQPVLDLALVERQLVDGLKRVLFGVGVKS